MEQSQGTGAAGGALQGAAVGAQVGGVYGAVIGGVIGGVAGFLGGGGEKAAKRAAKRQAEEILRAARENRRSQTRQANIQVSTAKARTYASNLIDRGSTRKYRDVLESEYRRKIDFDFSSAQMQANTVRSGGKAAAAGIKRAGFGQLLSGVAAAGGAYADAGGFEKSDSGGVLKDKAGSFENNETSSSPGYINF